MVHRQAVLQFQTIPTDPHEQAQFDAQIRELYNAPTIAESLVTDTPTKVLGLCAILAKPSFSMEDRTALLDGIEALYPGYP